MSNFCGNPIRETRDDVTVICSGADQEPAVWSGCSGGMVARMQAELHRREQKAGCKAPPPFRVTSDLVRVVFKRSCRVPLLARSSALQGQKDRLNKGSPGPRSQRGPHPAAKPLFHALLHISATSTHRSFAPPRYIICCDSSGLRDQFSSSNGICPPAAAAIRPPFNTSYFSECVEHHQHRVTDTLQEIAKQSQETTSPTNCAERPRSRPRWR